MGVFPDLGPLFFGFRSQESTLTIKPGPLLADLRLWPKPMSVLHRTQLQPVEGATATSELVAAW